jgi:1-acyl-sn-glycerol-3-phosphate acyltransferase
VPSTGPFVLAPVHRSFIDFGIVSGVTRRQMGYMGKESLWNSKLLGWFISILGAYPVNRGAPDREALRRTLAVLERGEPLVLFPEGTRRAGPVIDHLAEGAAFVASRASVPIVPVGIGGSERALPKGKRIPRPVKIHVIVGEPLVPAPIAEGARHPSRRAVKELTIQLQGVLQGLFDRAQRRAGVEL